MHFGLILEILPLKLVKAFSTLTNNYGSKFPPILHFVKKYKIPWILKWQYVIMDDKIERHWYVKWWDKYPQIDATINNIKFLSQTPKDQNLPPITAPLLLTPNVFLPPPKEIAFTTSPATTSFGSFFQEKERDIKSIFGIPE
jgi:hypothetical protein